MFTVWTYIDETYPRAADSMHSTKIKAQKRVKELQERNQKAWIEPTTQYELNLALEAESERRYCADAAEAEFGNSY